MFINLCPVISSNWKIPKSHESDVSRSSFKTGFEYKVKEGRELAVDVCFNEAATESLELRLSAC